MNTREPPRAPKAKRKPYRRPVLEKYGTVRNLRGPFADQQLVGHEAAVALRRPVSGHPQRPACPQASGQLPAQRSAALHIERLIDRLMRHAHRLIIGEVNP